MTVASVMGSIYEILRFIILYLNWLILLIWIFYLKMKWKKWPLEAVIIEKRGDNLIKSNDRAGRYQDPYTKTIGYKLQKSGDNIPVVNFDAVLHNVSVSTTLFDRFVNLIRGNAGTIFLFRYGSKQYKPIKVTQNGKLVEKLQEIKDDKGNNSYINIYKVIDPRNKLGELDFEVVDWDNMNQMVQEWRTTDERRQKSKEFWKQIVIPAIIIGAATLLAIVMIKFGYDWSVSARGATPPAETKANIPIIDDILP